MKITVDWFFVKEYPNNSAIDLLGIDPIPASKFYSESQKALFGKCPAYTDMMKNTYVVCSPIDYEIEINKEQNWLNVVEPKDLQKEYVNPRFTDQCDSPYPLFSISFGCMIFVSRKEDVWIEQIDTFLEWERKNEIRLIPGKFNIHRWVRPLDCAFEQKQKNMTVKIKRGDPLYYVRFHGKNPSDIIELNRIEQNDRDMNDYRANTGLKMFYKNCSLKFLYQLRDNFLKKKLNEN